MSSEIGVGGGWAGLVSVGGVVGAGAGAGGGWAGVVCGPGCGGSLVEGALVEGRAVGPCGDGLDGVCGRGCARATALKTVAASRDGRNIAVG